MTVLALKSVEPSLRGELSLWLIEVQAGVFVGVLPKRVRELLWERIVRRGEGSGVMMCAARNEQGFEVRSFGDPQWEPVDFEGVTLIRFRNRRRAR